MLSSVEILILSAIQGISEFLPVSSAAHLVLVSKYYAFANQNLLIDICLHLGSLIAIVVYFRNDLFNFVKNKSFLIEVVNMNKPIYEFLKNKWYFDEFYEYLLVKPSKKLGLFLWKKIDGETIDRLGPDGVSKIIKFFSMKAVKLQSGYIYQYAFVMLIGLSLILTVFILK